MADDAVRTSFFLSAALLEAAKAAARAERVTLRAWLTRLIERELTKHRRGAA